jgi:hypothetical protein
MRLAFLFETKQNLGQGIKGETRCNDTMNVMSERGFVLAVHFFGSNGESGY